MKHSVLHDLKVYPFDNLIPSQRLLLLSRSVKSSSILVVSISMPDLRSDDSMHNKSNDEGDIKNSRLHHSDSELNHVDISDRLLEPVSDESFVQVETSQLRVLCTTENDTGENQNESNENCHSSKKSGSGICDSKKGVHFADEHGFNIAEIREYDSDDEINVPVPSIFTEENNKQAVSLSSWVMDFTNPSSNYVEYYLKLNSQGVLLKEVTVEETTCSGMVLVKNIDYSKTVVVRVTYNLWKSFMDIPAFYCESSFKSPYDQFKFTLSLPDENDCDIIEFAIKFDCSNVTLWDNNDSKNYRLHKEKNSVQSASSSHGVSERNLICPSNLRYDEHMHPNFEFYRDKYDRYGSWNHFTDENRYY